MICTAVKSVKQYSCCAITQRIVVIPCRRFGTTYRSHLQESRNSWVRNCYYTLRNGPDEGRSYYMKLAELNIIHLLNPKQSKHFTLYSPSQRNASISIFYFYKYRCNNTVLPVRSSSKMSCYQNPLTLTKFPQPAAKLSDVIKSITTMLLRLLGFVTSTLCCFGWWTVLCGSKWQQLLTPFHSLPLWRGRQRDFLQRRLLSAALHGAILQKAVIFTSPQFVWCFTVTF